MALTGAKKTNAIISVSNKFQRFKAGIL